MFQQVVIVAMARTAVGSFGGSLRTKSAVDLGAAAIRGVLDRAALEGGMVDEVILGCVGQYGLNSFIARLAALQAGIPAAVPAQTVNRMCASGLQAIVTGALLIEHGDARAVVAGGAESMSNYPYTLNDARWGMRMGAGDRALTDSLTTALCEPMSGEGVHIGITAENITARYGLTREQLDRHALESQERALRAIAQGKFREEIIPVEVGGRRETLVFDTDEHPRETSLEKLSRLRPFVKPDGVVTAGNASGINDAGAALLLMHKDKAQALGLKPLARLVDFACAGVDPAYMGMGPVDATRQLLQKTGYAVADIDLAEINEAFAAQALACIQQLGLDPHKVNVNGSGISLGHPIGATGAIITIRLLAEMARRGSRLGLASLCIGGGQGMSVLFERL